MRESGRLDDPSPVKPEVRNKGQPEDRIAGDAGGAGATRETWNPAETGSVEGIRSSGKLEWRSPAQPKGRGRWATIGIGRRLSQRKRGRGNLEPQPRWAGRSRMRPTRNLIDRQRWSMHDPMSDRITVRRRQRPQGFWRFRLWGGWYPTLNWSDDQFRMGHPVYGGSATNLEWGTRRYL